jgi:hypothetical protein
MVRLVCVKRSEFTWGGLNIKDYALTFANSLTKEVSNGLQANLYKQNKRKKPFDKSYTLDCVVVKNGCVLKNINEL